MTSPYPRMCKPDEEAMGEVDSAALALSEAGEALLATPGASYTAGLQRGTGERGEGERQSEQQFGLGDILGSCGRQGKRP